MAIAVTEARKLPSLRSIRVTGTLVFSGNYATGGEVAPFVKPGTTKAPYGGRVYGIGTHDYKFDPVTGKILIFLAGVQIAAAAYPAGVTGDTVYFDIEYAKFG